MDNRTQLELADPLPWSEQITRYDEEHFVTYLRLLDAESAGLPDGYMCRIILELDPVRYPQKASRVLRDHMRRAKWMTKTGYKVLLQQS
jgi:hypothetical protein